jgi:uncharacterized membrane protein YciS (DUF1049 family)
MCNKGEYNMSYLIEIGIVAGLILGALQLIFNVFKFKSKKNKNQTKEDPDPNG